MNRDKPASKGADCTIQDIYYLENIEQLEAIADPIRFRMYFMMKEPKTGAQLARALGISRARAHYHLKILKDAGLVRFCGEGSSHGITEKYYQMIAHYLDSSKLVPKGFTPNETTFRTLKAMVRIIANLLDTSREGISRLKAHESVGIGFHYTLNTKLTPAQFKRIEGELIALKNRLIEMGRENERSGKDRPLVSCRATLFLTPIADDTLESEPG